MDDSVDTERAATARSTTEALIKACWSTQVIHAAVKLGIPELLAHAPMRAEAIAQACGTLPRTTFRLLRALASLGLCRDLGDERFELKPEGRVLCANAPGSLRNVALHWGGRTWSALAHLDEAVTTGAAWNHAGRDGFYSMAQRPAESARFNEAMAAQTAGVARAITDAYDFSAFRTVIDVGGGYGALLAQILRSNPHLRGATADLAHMEAEATSFLAEGGLEDRLRFIPTDFFARIEPGADCYLLKAILHDWNDADSIAILRSAATAAAGGGVVLIVERIAPERIDDAGSGAGVIRADIQMMASNGGMERTLAEYRELIASAGLELIGVARSRSQFSILQCRPVRASRS